MSKVIIFHGSGSSPHSFWIPWLKNNLEKEGYIVETPELPDAQNPDIKKWLPFALEKFTYDEDTILIGHSAGCPLILSILEKIDIPVKQAILVAGFCTPLNKGEREPIVQKKYDWDKIRARSKEFIFINSDNDPWGCDEKQGKKMFEKLGGKLIILHGEGHMGSDKFNQPYMEFPFLFSQIEQPTKNRKFNSALNGTINYVKDHVVFVFIGGLLLVLGWFVNVWLIKVTPNVAYQEYLLAIWTGFISAVFLMIGLKIIAKKYSL